MAGKKTKEKIKNGLTELLGETDMDKITATALCEHAGINRATFYYHYNSVADVFAEIEKDIENEFIQWLAHASMNVEGAPEKSFYVKFFEFVYRNANVCRLLLRSNYQSDFLQRALEVGRIKVIATMAKLHPDCPSSKIDYYYIFVSHGFLGLLEYWLSSGMRESVNEIAEIGERVSYLGIEYLK